MLWGMPLPLSDPRSPHLCVASREPARAIRHRRTVATERPAWWTTVHHLGLRVHAPAETWGSLARTLSVPDLVAVAEYAVTGVGKTPAIATIDQFDSFLARASGMTGVRRLRDARDRIRIGARSRPETLLRLLLEDAGLPSAVINPEYRLRSGRKVIPDLAWPEYRVAVEYDGGHHRDPRQFVDDVVRTDEMVDDGWHVVHVVAPQLFDRPHEIVARVVQRLASRGAVLASVTRITHFKR
jgi:very-short-patch-repair endonuclease